MRKWWKSILLGIVITLLSATHVAADETMLFFYGQGCPHCAIVEKYFDENNSLEIYPIVKKEIYSTPANAKLYNQRLDQLGIPQNQRGVPTLIDGERVVVGGTPIIEYFEKYSSENSEAIVTKREDKSKQDTLSTKVTLAAVVGASIVDAINPCAFAVLIILMSTILVAGSSKKALKAGLAFALSIFISYLLMGLGLYKAISIGGVSGVFFKVVGWLAVLLGLLNLKDYFWYGKGFLMEVPLSWRPKLQKLLKSVSSPFGAFSVGFLVSLFLLPCTSGPYIVVLGMLAERQTQTQAFLYLLLYNFIFVLPMIFITLAVYKGLDPKKAENIRQKRLKTLHLIAGIILLAMGIVILKGWV